MGRIRSRGIAGICLLAGFFLSAVAHASTAENLDLMLRVTEEAMVVLNDASSHGLVVPDQDLAALEAAHADLMLGRSDLDWFERIRVFAVDALLAYAVDFESGQKRPSRARRDGLRAAISAAVYTGTILHWYKSRIPEHPEYHRLRGALLQLEHNHDDASWPMIGPGPTLEPGDRGERVERLRARLGLSIGDGADAEFDESVSRAVLAYQRQHGLDADGLVGRRTLAHLDVTVEQRKRQIRSNLERWRRSELAVSGRQIRVNLPSYELEYRDGEGFSGHMRVVIGDLRSRTPLLTDAIEYLVFSPYWDVPDRIARRAILPRLTRDADYLDRMRFDVYAKETHRLARSIDWDSFARRGSPYFLRQQPGPNNSLGRLKFMFPNPDYIYMHDTSAPQLFAKSRRALSNGCIRVEHASRLAEWVLGEQADWDVEKIESAMAAGEPRRVELDETVPIAMTYFTVVAHESGSVSFYEDIYEHELDASAAMASTYLPERAASGLISPQVTAN